MKAILALVLGLFCLGCGNGVNYGLDLGQDQDIADIIIWKYSYKMDGFPPLVEWLTGDQLDCGDGWGFYRGNYYGEPATMVRPDLRQCVYGVFWTANYVTQVAIHDIDPKHYQLSWTSLAHEYRHAVLFKRTGDPDVDHVDKEWALGGVVDQANEELRRYGL